MLISGVWSVLRLSQISGNTQESRRHDCSICFDLHAMRYMLAVGPPRSEMMPVKPGLVADRLDFTDDRIFAAALDDAALVLGDRTESAAAEAATHDVDRETDHFPRGNLGVTVARVRRTRERQVVNRVHLRRGKRDWRRVQPDVALTVRLSQGAGVAGVGFEVEHARGMRVQHGIVLHLIVVG